MTKVSTVGFVVGLCCLSNPIAHAQKERTADQVRSTRALLDAYCVTCHNDRLKTAGFTFEALDTSNVAANADVFEKIVRRLRSGTMPPEGRPKPDHAVVESVLAELETALDHAASVNPNPGRIVSHRLNRTEYVNTIKDLLDLEIDGNQL